MVVIRLYTITKYRANGRPESHKTRIAFALFVSCAAVAAPACAEQPATAISALHATFVFEARVKVDRPLVIGPGSHGLRRVVPISGGSVDGPALRGVVVPGGADWQACAPTACSRCWRSTP